MKSAARLFTPSLTGCLLMAILLPSCIGSHGRRTFPVLGEPPRAAETSPPETPPAKISPPQKSQPIRVQYGVASWYGKKFHGRRTASGSIYNMYAKTAAHRKVELGTYARVTNLRNGRTIRVLINDRGPYIRGRILDLSYGAARKLRMVRRGTVRVKVRFLGTETAAVQAPDMSNAVAAMLRPAVSEHLPPPPSPWELAFNLRPDRWTRTAQQ